MHHVRSLGRHAIDAVHTVAHLKLDARPPRSVKGGHVPDDIPVVQARGYLAQDRRFLALDAWDDQGGGLGYTPSP